MDNFLRPNLLNFLALLLVTQAISNNLERITVKIGVIYSTEVAPDLPEVLQRMLDSLTANVASLERYDFRLYIEMMSNCSVTDKTIQGTALAAKLYQTQHIDALFGPMCYTELDFINRLIGHWELIEFNFWNEFFNEWSTQIVQMSTTSSLNTAYNLIAFLKAMNWDKITLVWSSTAFNSEYETDLRISNLRGLFRLENITLIHAIRIDNTSAQSVESIANEIYQIQNSSKVLLSLFGYSVMDNWNFLSAVQQISDEESNFVTIMLELVTLEPFNPPWMLPNGSVDRSVKQFFRDAVILVNDYYSSEKISEIENILPKNLDKIHTLMYLHLYETLWLYTKLMDKSGKSDMDMHNPTNKSTLLALIKTSDIKGPFGHITLNEYSIRLVPYRVLLVLDNSNKTIELVTIQSTTKCPMRQLGNQQSCINLEGHVNQNQLSKLSGEFLMDVPVCGFNGELCDQTGTILVIAAVMMAFVLMLGAFLVYRKLKTGETSQMPWVILYNTIKFVDFQVSSMMSIQSLQKEMESKAQLKDLLRTRQLATIELYTVIVESHVLKERLVFDKADIILLHQMKQLVHDNVNQFIGICFDRRTEFYVIWNHCMRGTLADLMFCSNEPNGICKNEGITRSTRPAFDKNIESAFGLEFLHSSTIGYHGSLTPTQCLVDSRWILKLSGFGISRLLYNWRIKGSIGAKDDATLIPNSDLHYYSPEMRRILKAMQKNNIKIGAKQGQSADMYAFGVILCEIVCRRKSVYIEDRIGEGSENDFAIFFESAEQLVPLYPSTPDSNSVHPDLLALMHKCWSGITEQRPDAMLARKITDATLKFTGSLVDQMIKNMEQYTNNLELLVKERTSQLEEAQQHAERLLLELLPKSVADELKLGRRVEPKNYKSSTVMYSDIVGFTSLCSESLPLEVVNLLSGIFQQFDRIISTLQCYKVETIGDAYMVTSGVPIASRYDHVRNIATVALMMREFLFKYEIPHRPGHRLHCRWGFNTGPVFAGVVGLCAPRFCLFGETVTLASKMENTGLPDHIQITLRSYQLLSARYPEFKCTPRSGGVRIEGFGTLLTYWLTDCEDYLKSSRSRLDDENEQNMGEE